MHPLSYRAVRVIFASGNEVLTLGCALCFFNDVEIVTIIWE